jgi:anti-sigma factor RsiW
MAHIRTILSTWRCRRLAAHLVDYAEGALSPRDRVGVEGHLRDCAACRATLAALQTVPDTLRGAMLPADETRWAHQRHAIMEAVRRHAPAPEQSRRWAWQPGLAAAALVVVTVLSYRALQQDTPHRPLAVDEFDAESADALAEVVATLSDADWLAADDALTAAAGPAIVGDLHDLADEELTALGELLGHQTI